IDVSEVAVEGMTADVARLAAILPPPSETPAAPSPWAIDVGRALVRDAAVTIAVDGRPRRVDGIQIDARIAQRAGRLSVALASARARWADEDVTATLRGDVDVEGDEARVTNVIAEAGGSRLVVPRAAVRTDAGGAAGGAHVTLAAADVRRLFPGAEWAGDVSLSASFAGAKHWTVHAVGTIAGAPASIDARVTPAPPAVEATVRLHGIDPAAVWAGAPRGAVHVEATADLRGGPELAAP